MLWNASLYDMSLVPRRSWLGTLVVMLACCTSTPPQEAAAPSATPAVTVTASANPADEYLLALTGFRYAPLEAPLPSFVKELESGSLQDIVAGKSARSIVFNGDPYRVAVYVYALRPLAAGAAGAQEDITDKIAGAAWTDDVGLGGRTVAYIEKSSLAAYAWLQRTFYVVVVGTNTDTDRTYAIARALIDANTTEARYIITGQVTSKMTGGPLSGVEIVLFKGGFARCCDLAMPSVITGSTGRYQMTAPEGNYRIMFYPRGIDGYGTTWWKDGATFESAIDLTVTKNTNQIDGALPVGHVVRGTVTSNFGGVLSGAHVDVFSADGGWVTSATTVDDGRYLLRLVSGDYRVYVSAPHGSELHGLWWPGVTASDRSRLLGVPSKDSQQLDIELKGEVKSN
ncbi:MAG: carboxypeptidase-like regulatory domain-containing protein [Chloroflexota bacterium]|nr:carboxypeptidase-like regulatory domain-containing protein [Chloroflexota bacterium]